MKKIIVIGITLLCLTTCFLPITNAKSIEIESSSKDNIESVNVLCYIIKEDGKETIKSSITSDELIQVKETLKKIQTAIITLRLKESSKDEKANANNILENSYSKLKKFGLLSDDIDKEKFVDITTGENNIFDNSKNQKIIDLCNRFLNTNDDENSSFAMSTSFMGNGSNVNTLNIIDVFAPVIPVLSFFFSNFANVSKVLSFIFLFTLILLVTPIHFLSGIFNVFSTVTGNHSITALGNNTYGIDENPGIYTKSFFIMTSGLWIEIPTNFSDNYPFYSSEWFYVGVGLWTGIK